MKSAPASLIIVSQKRPEHLLRLLQSLRHQTHDNFEVIIVADTTPSSFVNHVKYIPFTDANISAARNTGIAVAAGEIIAFCDDDAIPDPPWLEHLVHLLLTLRSARQRVSRVAATGSAANGARCGLT